MEMFGKKTEPIPSQGGSVFGSTTFAWDDKDKQPAPGVYNALWRAPRQIRLNDNIVVREDEIAVFYRDGKALTYFDQPNRYALTDFNAPIVGKLLKFFQGVTQWAEVYYVPKRYLDGKFGSAQPYQFTDPTFGVVNLRVYGEYRWKISSPELFINQFVGTFGADSSDDVEGRVKEQMVILVYNTLGKMKAQGLKVTDLAASLMNIEQEVLAAGPDNLGQFGIEINKISGLTISLPEEVQQAIDTRSQMQVLGVSYMQYQTGKAIDDAAKNPSGGAGVTAGLGAGLGVGYAIGGQMAQGIGAQIQTKSCPKCGSLIPANTKFCPNCGAEQLQPQGPPAPAGAPKFCPNCGSQVAAGTKFCANCGKPL
jgi:membrane protease subunit (stomatin/prohibitin family)